MIEVIDNCVSQEHLHHMQNIMLNNSFPWFFSNTKVGNDLPSQQDNYDCQFIHLFYHNMKPSSNYGDLIEPVLDILQPSALVRIKANLTTCADKVYNYPPHVDFFNFNGKTAIFYLNTNNGYTEFASGEKVESVENRLVIFDGNMEHSGTTHTDAKTRAVINFNYYTWLRAE